MANTSGHSKKVTRNAIMFLSYCVGNIIAPQFFISSEAPDYLTGYYAILVAISKSKKTGTIDRNAVRILESRII